MIDADRFLAAATTRGYTFCSGVPCSYLSPLINAAIEGDGLRYVPAANEGDALAIAAGATLAGGRAIVMFQNSGLGNAINPLTSLSQVFGIPALLLISLRGEPGGPPDEPQHAVMGPATTPLLDTLGIPWRWFPREEADVTACLDTVDDLQRTHRSPVALVVRKSDVRPRPLTRAAATSGIEHTTPEPIAFGESAPPDREAVLRTVLECAHGSAAIVATTGYTSRSLYALGDAARNLYVVGSMGCASSVALGLALSRPDRKVVVLDGDGALLMRLGALATLAAERPPNLLHLALDNGQHESTGGQSTVTSTADLGALAAAAGYPVVRRAWDLASLRAALTAGSSEGLAFVHVRTAASDPSGLPRPSITPPEVAARFSRWFAGPVAQ